MSVFLNHEVDYFNNQRLVFSSNGHASYRIEVVNIDGGIFFHGDIAPTIFKYNSSEFVDKIKWVGSMLKPDCCKKYALEKYCLGMGLSIYDHRFVDLALAKSEMINILTTQCAEALQWDDSVLYEEKVKTLEAIKMVKVNQVFCELDKLSKLEEMKGILRSSGFAFGALLFGLKLPLEVNLAVEAAGLIYEKIN